MEALRVVCPVACPFNDDGARLGDEVHANHAQILDHGGGSTIRAAVVHQHTVAGVVVAGGRVVDFIGHVEGDLGLSVVVRGWVENGARNFVSKLQVGVLDGDAGDPATL